MEDISRTIETVYRIERTRLVAGLAAYMRDLSLAEECAQEALLSALSAWPRTGIPQNPAAWLMVTAKRRAIDHMRRRTTEAKKEGDVTRIFYEPDASEQDLVETAMDDDIRDDRLALIFTACHPALPPSSRVALTLKVVAGLSTAEIARAFVTSEATASQRVLRAKNQLGAAPVVYEVPHGPERDQRLASVLEVIYLIFNEGYAATSGSAALRPPLAEEAMRLGRILATLLSEEAEVLGLLALMELQAARFPARVDRNGMPVPITEQDRTRWDRLLLTHGLAALDHAFAAGNPGPYTLQAAIAACHGRAPTAAATDWATIAAIYDRLVDLLPTPIVALNRAIAHSMATGPELGLLLLAEIEHLPALAAYAPLYAAKGDCMLRAGENIQAEALFEKAASLSKNDAERAWLKRQIIACGS